MKIRACLLALLLVGAAGCGDAPTGAEVAGPLFNGGYVIGSGNRSDSTAAPTGNGTQSGSGAETEPAADSEVESAAGGYVIGSGN
jgi:hypothetical protein